MATTFKKAALDFLMNSDTFTSNGANIYSSPERRHTTGKRTRTFSSNSHRRLLKKYKDHWFGAKSVRKKHLISLPKKVLQSNDNKTFSNKQFKNNPKRYSDGIESKESRNHTLSVLSQTSVCTEFPISEIGAELSGNRGNGNSPFNSSNSCGSPENIDSVNSTYSETHKSLGQDPLEKDNYHCDGEQGPVNNCHKFCSDEEPNNQEGICDHPSKLPDRELADEDDDAEQDFVDVESVDDSDNENVTVKIAPVSPCPPRHQLSNIFDLEECLTKQIPLHIDVSLANKSCGISRGHRKSSFPSISPIKWQQQFMSFLSNSSNTEPMEEEQYMETSSQCNKTTIQSNSPRKKRSRRARSSVCPCCIGTSGHKKGQKHHKKITREQKHFIRDMVQLVSLRNKVVQLFCSLFPQCEAIIKEMNQDSERVDNLIDDVISILKEPDTCDNFNTARSLCKSPDTLSDSGTEPVDMSDYPDLEKQVDYTDFQDKESEDMPVLDFMDEDQLMAPKKTDKKAVVYQLQTNTKLLPQYMNDAGVTDQSLNTPPSGRGEFELTSVFSEGDSGIINDHDISNHSHSRTSPSCAISNHSHSRTSPLCAISNHSHSRTSPLCAISNHSHSSTSPSCAISNHSHSSTSPSCAISNHNSPTDLYCQDKMCNNFQSRASGETLTMFNLQGVAEDEKSMTSNNSFVSVAKQKDYTSPEQTLTNNVNCKQNPELNGFSSAPSDKDCTLRKFHSMPDDLLFVKKFTTEAGDDRKSHDNDSDKGKVQVQLQGKGTIVTLNGNGNLAEVVRDTIKDNTVDFRGDHSSPNELLHQEKALLHSVSYSPVYEPVSCDETEMSDSHYPVYSDISEASTPRNITDWTTTVGDDPFISRWGLNGARSLNTGLISQQFFDSPCSKLLAATNDSVVDDIVNMSDQDFSVSGQCFQTSCDEVVNSCSSISSSSHKKSEMVEIFDSSVVLCSKPKICLRAMRNRIFDLVQCLLPEVVFSRRFKRNTDALEMLLDAVNNSNSLGESSTL